MTSGQFVQKKLQAWATRKGISLQGSAGERGEPNYTYSIEQNLFDQILLPSVKASFERGAGGELRGSIPTMSALHSSAAMAVNLFQYWVRNGDLATLAGLLEIPSLDVTSAEFEDRFPVCEDGHRYGFNEAPHLDFAFRYQDGSRVGIECKLYEPYGRLDHAPLRHPYLNLTGAWGDIPACRALAERLAAGPAGFHRLGASQLLKHILGLKFGAATAKVRLLYVYCDAIGDEAAEHREEIRRFEQDIEPDPIRFVPMSVQEFILRAVTRARGNHLAYVDYIAERYL
jgi:restriction endonuclease-like protein